MRAAAAGDSRLCTQVNFVIDEYENWGFAIADGVNTADATAVGVDEYEVEL